MQITTDSSNIMVVGNFDINSGSGTVTFANAGTWYDYLTGETITATGAPQSISLQPGEYHLYVNRNVTNIIPTPVFDIPNLLNQLQVNVLLNPVQAASALKINLPASGHLQLMVIDALGRERATYDAGFKTKGAYQYLLSDITKGRLNKSGVYTLKVNFSNLTTSVKILVQE